MSTGNLSAHETGSLRLVHFDDELGEDRNCITNNDKCTEFVQKNSKT